MRRRCGGAWPTRRHPGGNTGARDSGSTVNSKAGLWTTSCKAAAQRGVGSSVHLRESQPRAQHRVTAIFLEVRIFISCDVNFTRIHDRPQWLRLISHVLQKASYREDLPLTKCAFSHFRFSPKDIYARHGSHSSLWLCMLDKHKQR